MALKGHLGSIQGLKRKLKEFPVSLRHEVAQAAAPVLTTMTQKAHSSNLTVYDEARPGSTVTGAALDLDETGATKRGLRFVSTGSLIRCALPERYTRFLIGKYNVLPNGPIPLKWQGKLADIVAAQKANLK